jgi:DNA-binding transcriptional regulator YiaG
MNLARYLKRNGLSVEQFARQVDASTQAVRYWTAGDHVPSPTYMRRIQLITGGKVQPNDFFPQKSRTGTERAANP